MYKKTSEPAKLFSIVASLLMIFSLLTPGIARAESKENLHESVHDSKTIATAKLSDRLQDEFKTDDKVTFLVKFTEKADTEKAAKKAKEAGENKSLSAQKLKLTQRSAVVSELKSTSLVSQENVVELLEAELKSGNVEDFNPYFIVNGISVTANKEIAEKIASFDEVEKILPNETRQLNNTFVEEAEVPDTKQDDIEWNVDRVNAPQAWSMGIDGSGTVVASLDTGVNWEHPGLIEQYRGYDSETGDVDHEFSFYDATASGQEAAYDDNGHGSHVTGTMVGVEPDGSNQVGVAPGSKWIAAKVFDAAGSTTDAVLLDAAEWIIAPGGQVDMAPDAVNNSWGGGPGLDEWYRDTVRAWRAAEIFPEFAAGNTDLFNPGGPESVVAPSNYPESFAVGATDNNDEIAGFSLRGPSPYEEIKPNIAAPGVGIRSTMPDGGYADNSGTSMASPAVTGIAAMLRQADASITVDQMEEVLINTATPLTDNEYPETPNNAYGHGLINAYDAVSSMMDGLGEVEGQVTKEGEDNEAPVFEHTAPGETYSGMDLDLFIQASDNVSIASVTLEYQIGEDWEGVEAELISGDYLDGEYVATIAGEEISGDSFTYRWIVNDFGDNEVVSDEYTIDVQSGITTGYFEDFEAKPVGWTTYGEENSWEWGEPTSGPENAASGENVYATNLAGTYGSNMNASLEMPPIDLPDSDVYLQFKQWSDFEKYDSGNAYDFGHVFISTDQEEWEQLLRVEGLTDDWEDAEVDLSQYRGQRVYIAFNATSDGSIVKDGWYIDDVGLTDTSMSSKSSLFNDTSRVSGFNNQSFSNGVGIAEAVEKVEAKPFVDPDKITPQSKEKEQPIKDGGQINPALLPIGAQVSVLESGRSVHTNPEDGTYSLMHATGDYTVQAEAYGFESKEQTVTVHADESSTANFMLEEIEQAIVSGLISDEATGEAVADATVLLVEDANIEPTQTDESGNYTLEAYKGSYTLRVIAKGYHSKDIEVSLEEDIEVNAELEPFYTVPGGEIGYDDGTAENARAFYDAGNGWAVKMSLPEDKETAIVTDGVFKFWGEEFPDPGGTAFEVEVWDATGKDGQPGSKIAGPFEGEAIRDELDWTVIDLSEHNIIVGEEYYMVYIQTEPNPVTPALATDENGPNAARSYQYVGGSWSPSPADEGNYMIRSRVSYEVDVPVITSPEQDLLTNESDITVEGEASPTTTIQVVNNGEEVGSTDVGDDGTFAMPIELVEGANELTAVSLIDGTSTGESETVNVTLDTMAPEVTIDSPSDGDKINRESVTVEGMIADENLDSVTVNGQEAKVQEESYSKRILLENGNHDIEVKAVDKAGNETTESITVDVKYDAPKVENLTPTEDVYLQTGKSVKFEFDSEPGLQASFSIHMPLTNTGASLANATELPMMEVSEGHYVGYWTAPADLTADGAVIEVKAVDKYKNETRQTAEGKLFINLDE